MTGYLEPLRVNTEPCSLCGMAVGMSDHTQDRCIALRTAQALERIATTLEHAVKAEEGKE
jgi:hypothetical protein